MGAGARRPAARPRVDLHAGDRIPGGELAHRLAGAPGAVARGHGRVLVARRRAGSAAGAAPTGRPPRGAARPRRPRPPAAAAPPARRSRRRTSAATASSSERQALGAERTEDEVDAEAAEAAAEQVEEVEAARRGLHRLRTSATHKPPQAYGSMHSRITATVATVKVRASSGWTDARRGAGEDEVGDEAGDREQQAAGRQQRPERQPRASRVERLRTVLATPKPSMVMADHAVGQHRVEASTRRPGAARPRRTAPRSSRGPGRVPRGRPSRAPSASRAYSIRDRPRPTALTCGASVRPPLHSTAAPRATARAAR